jgi:hypothetical protein
MSIESSHPDAGPPVRVSPISLRSTGGELRRVGHDLAGKVREALPVTAAASTGCPGWAAGAAAAEAAHGWRELLTDLAGQVDELGQAFRTAADAYCSCDERAAARTAGAVPW